MPCSCAMRRIHLSDLMLMAGVLNSEVEKIRPASYRGTGPGSKRGTQISPIRLDFLALTAISSAVSHQNRETFAKTIGTYRKKGYGRATVLLVSLRISTRYVEFRPNPLQEFFLLFALSL